MFYCFLDTNIFLQFQDIEQIDWLEELKVAEVCLVVTAVVLGELDKFKHYESRRLRNRSRKALKYLGKLDIHSDNPVRKGVVLQFRLEEPDHNALKKYQLNSANNDSMLVGSALIFANKHKDDDVILVTDDSGPSFKAKAHDLRAQSLSESYRLEEQPDPLVAENRRLKNELFKLQNNQPKLDIGFTSSDGEIKHHLKAKVYFTKDLINEDEIESAIKAKYQELRYVRKKSTFDPLNPRSVPDFSDLLLKEEQIDDYHDQVKEYLHGPYRQYLIRNSLFQTFHIYNQYVELALVIKNSGAAPAQGVEITLLTNDCREVLTEAPRRSEYPRPPLPPRRPQPFQMDLSSYLPPNHLVDSLFISGTSEFEGWELIDTDNPNLRQAEHFVERMMHHRSMELDKLYLIIDEPEQFPVSIQIKYEIIAENLIDKLNGELKIIINGD